MTLASRQRDYERLARRFHAGIYKYLRWLCRDETLAEDLTQETFAKPSPATASAEQCTWNPAVVFTTAPTPLSICATCITCSIPARPCSTGLTISTGT